MQDATCVHETHRSRSHQALPPFGPAGCWWHGEHSAPMPRRRLLGVRAIEQRSAGMQNGCRPVRWWRLQRLWRGGVPLSASWRRWQRRHSRARCRRYLVAGALQQRSAPQKPSWWRRLRGGWVGGWASCVVLNGCCWLALLALLGWAGGWQCSSAMLTVPTLPHPTPPYREQAHLPHQAGCCVCGLAAAHRRPCSSTAGCGGCRCLPRHSAVGRLPGRLG